MSSVDDKREVTSRSSRSHASSARTRHSQLEDGSLISRPRRQLRFDMWTLMFVHQYMQSQFERFVDKSGVTKKFYLLTAVSLLNVVLGHLFTGCFRTAADTALMGCIVSLTGCHLTIIWHKGVMWSGYSKWYASIVYFACYVVATYMSMTCSSRNDAEATGSNFSMYELPLVWSFVAGSNEHVGYAGARFILMCIAIAINSVVRSHAFPHASPVSAVGDAVVWIKLISASAILVAGYIVQYLMRSMFVTLREEKVNFRDAKQCTRATKLRACSTMMPKHIVERLQQSAPTQAFYRATFGKLPLSMGDGGEEADSKTVCEDQALISCFFPQRTTFHETTWLCGNAFIITINFDVNGDSDPRFLNAVMKDIEEDLSENRIIKGRCLGSKIVYAAGFSKDDDPVKCVMAALPHLFGLASRSDLQTRIVITHGVAALAVLGVGYAWSDIFGECVGLGVKLEEIVPRGAVSVPVATYAAFGDACNRLAAVKVENLAVRGGHDVRVMRPGVTSPSESSDDFFSTTLPSPPPDVEF